MRRDSDQTPGAFMAFVSDEADLAVLKTFAGQQGWPEEDIRRGDIRTAADVLRQAASPQLLLVEVPSAADAPGLLDALAEVCGPDTRVIVAGTVNEYSFYCWLTDIGISSYLLRPITAPALESAYARSLLRPQDAAKQERPPGKVLGVLGARGGVGATTIALNLAGAVAAMAPAKQVALADMDPCSGSIALSLDLDPSRGMREALEKPERIDALFFDRVASKPLKNLSVLSSEESLGEPVAVHAQALDALLSALKDTFDVIILDVPRELSAFHRACLQRCDQVVLVSELSLLSLRDSLRITDLMRETLAVKPPLIVANRVGMGGRAEMQPGDYEKGVNAALAARVPFAPEVFMPISRAIPAVKKKGDKAVKALPALAEQLLPELKPRTRAPAKKAFFKKKP